MNQNRMFYVFTYGTLMHGQSNHSVMNTALNKFKDSGVVGSFIEPCITKESKFDLISISNAFPAIIDGNKQVVGELYQVPELSIVTSLDSLEGYPYMYDRKYVTAIGKDSNKEYQALIYYMTPEYLTLYKRTDKNNTDIHYNISCDNNVCEWLKK